MISRFNSAYAARMLLCILSFFVLAGLAQAQYSTGAVAPPGTTAADVQSVASWIRYIFYAIAIVLFIVACVSMAHGSHGGGIAGVAGCIICIILAGSADAIVTALYHGGAG